MSQIFAVIVVGRQIYGEYVFVRTERAFSKASDADKLVAELNAGFTNRDGSPKPQKISTPQGDAECICVAGGHSLELE